VVHNVGAEQVELRKEVEETADRENWYRHVGKDWGNVLITEVGPDTDPALVGLSIEGAAEHRGVDVWDAFFDLVAARGTGVCPQSMDEDQKRLAMRASFVTFRFPKPSASSPPFAPASCGFRKGDGSRRAMPPTLSSSTRTRSGTRRRSPRLFPIPSASMTSW
jgi:hypothetical protein